MGRASNSPLAAGVTIRLAEEATEATVTQKEEELHRLEEEGALHAVEEDTEIMTHT
jgi:hypothetical protein